MRLQRSAPTQAAMLERQLAAAALPVSDEERHAVIERLRGHYADGRLELEEFGERVSAALAARNIAELAGLLDDLRAQQPQTQAPSARPLAIHTLAFLGGSSVLSTAWLVLIPSAYPGGALEHAITSPPALAVAGWSVALAVHCWSYLSRTRSPGT